FYPTGHFSAGPAEALAAARGASDICLSFQEPASSRSGPRRRELLVRARERGCERLARPVACVLRALRALRYSAPAPCRGSTRSGQGPDAANGYGAANSSVDELDVPVWVGAGWASAAVVVVDVVGAPLGVADGEKN